MHLRSLKSDPCVGRQQRAVRPPGAQESEHSGVQPQGSGCAGLGCAELQRGDGAAGLAMHAVPRLGFCCVFNFFPCVSEWWFCSLSILSGGSACVEQDGVLPHRVWEKSCDSTLGVKK